MAESQGTPVIEGYGLSEASPVLSCNPMRRAKLGSIVVPLPSTEMKCVDDQGNEVVIGEPGEFVARGPQVMSGYWNQPEETKHVLRDGWLYTGDIGKIDDEGYFTIFDRRKDMILVSGFNVFPNEVEAVLAGFRRERMRRHRRAGRGQRGSVKAFVVRDDLPRCRGDARFLQA